MATEGDVKITKDLKYIITCSICLEVFSFPKMLSCQHTFCQLCLQNYRTGRSTMITCPECRKPSQIPDEGVIGFPTNLSIQALLDALDKAESSTNGTTGQENDAPGTGAADLSRFQDRIAEATTTLQGRLNEIKDFSDSMSQEIHGIIQAKIEQLKKASEDLQENLQRHVASETKLTKGLLEKLSHLEQEINDTAAASRLKEALEPLASLLMLERTVADLPPVEMVLDVVKLEFRPSTLLAIKSKSSIRIKGNGSQGKPLLQKPGTIQEGQQQKQAAPVKKVSFAGISMPPSRQRTTSEKQGKSTSQEAKKGSLGGVLKNARDRTSSNPETETGDQQAKRVVTFGKTAIPVASVVSRIRTTSNDSEDDQSTSPIVNGPWKMALLKTEEEQVKMYRPWAREIYCLSSDANRVTVYTPRGHSLRHFGKTGKGEGRFMCAGGLAIDGARKEIYVTDKYSCQVNVLTPEGTFLRQWGLKGDGEGHFLSPEGIAIDEKTPLIYVADPKAKKVQAFDRSGLFKRELGREVVTVPVSRHAKPHSVFKSPTDVAVAAVTGNVAVADGEQRKVMIFNISGQLIQTLSGVSGVLKFGFGIPECVAFDRNGFLLVGESERGRVLVFEPSGTCIKVIGHEILSDPRGIDLTPKGEILVADYSHNATYLLH
ncbi:unnamed protein product [Cyprideis torosa]|uniref:Uncharacterized protein n=1 Tax=Cyprideis torosa TaxID=163714 RepID=A0A7R8WGD1_9CRUS|nr:unnamed protein product [Cyprideis torosa]CAG0892837.1 unnamed protein product [Cyprideis torosa]